MLSIVTANWNGERFLEGFLSSLEGQSYRDFRLHFVDNGSSDGSLKVVAAHRGRLDISIHALAENTGFAHANNVGIEAAMGDASEWIVTLNNDLELEEGCLERLCAAIEAHPDVGFLQLLMVNYFERGRIDAAGIVFSPRGEALQAGYGLPIERLGELGDDIAAACAGAAAYRKGVLEEVREASGYFDDRFFAYSEDVDLGLRLKAHGIRGALVKDARVYHVHSGTGGSNETFKTYYLTRNLYLYLRKNLGEKEFCKARRQFLRYHMWTWAKQAAKGQFRLARAGIKGYRDFVHIQADAIAGNMRKDRPICPH